LLTQRRTAETAREIGAAARRLAATKGLSGFTIEELCAMVGIARRTFSNYYATKAAAVAGVSRRTGFEDLDEEFLLSAPRQSLVDDFSELVTSRWRRMGFTRLDLEELYRCTQNDPQLIWTLLETLSSSHEHDIMLLARHAGLQDDDVRVKTAVELLEALVLRSLADCLKTDSDSFEHILAQRVSLARDVLTPNPSAYGASS